MSKEAKKPLSLSRGKLELKKTVETGQVRQTFSHGRSKVVQVERKRKRQFEMGADGKVQEVNTKLNPSLSNIQAEFNQEKPHNEETAQRIRVLQQAKQEREEAKEPISVTKQEEEKVPDNSKDYKDKNNLDIINNNEITTPATAENISSAPVQPEKDIDKKDQSKKFEDIKDTEKQKQFAEEEEDKKSKKQN